MQNIIAMCDRFACGKTVRKGHIEFLSHSYALDIVLLPTRLTAPLYRFFGLVTFLQ